MKRIILALAVSIGYVTGIQAQNNSLGASDPEAKKILDAVSAKMKTYKAIQAAFSVKIEDSKGNPQGKKSGTAYVKGNKYHIIITGQEIYCDGKNIWTYDKSSNEVTVTKFDPDANGLTQKLFSNFYDKDYLYKLNGEKKMGTKTVQEIEMTPIDKTKNIFKIYLYIDKASKTAYSSKMLDKSGNVYIYTVNSLKNNPSLSDDSFVFNKAKYPGVEVVDLGN
jgi:outer membrane lipoprotein-sorting protein